MSPDPRSALAERSGGSATSSLGGLAGLVALLLAISLADGSILVRRSEVRSIAAGLALVLSFALAPGPRAGTPTFTRALHFGLVCAAAIVAVRAPMLLPISAAFVFLASPGFRSARALGWAAGGAGVLFWIRDSLPLWNGALRLSREWTATVTAGSDVAASWGPSYSGLWMFATFAIAAFAYGRGAPRRGRTLVLASVLVLLALALLTSWRLPDLASFRTRALHPEPDALWRWISFGFASIALAPLTLLATRVEAASPAVGAPRTRRILATSGAALVIAGIVAATPPSHTPERAPRVLLDGRGAFEMSSPQWGRYGPDAPQDASLANLPAVLETSGVPFARSDSTLTPETLREHDVLVVMNPLHIFESPEHDAVWSFVRSGGGLLVLADHTNIRETLGPLNALLSPTGIRVEFDSAIPFADRWTWYGCVRALPGPIARGLRDESRLRVSIGASLAVADPALPLLMGSAAFSDPGDSANARGAYLGNMQFDRGDPLGDLPIAAVQDVGRGRVLVLGDTSTFQRSALVTTRALALRSILALGPNARITAPLAHRRVGAVLLAAGATVLTLTPGGAPFAAGAALAAGAWIAFQEKSSRIESPSIVQDGVVAWIDLDHGNRVDLHAGRDDGLGGFTDHLERHGLLPLGCPSVDEATLAKGELYATIAPALPFAKGERAALRAYVEGGGLLVAAAGFEERQGIEALLADFGLSIGSTPIGSAHESRNAFQEERLSFHESWPVLTDGRGAETWAECWGAPLVVFARYGTGGVLAIGDSRFLTSSKLESAETFIEPNIRFLRAAIDSARRAVVEEGT